MATHAYIIQHENSLIDARAAVSSALGELRAECRLNGTDGCYAANEDVWATLGHNAELLAKAAQQLGDEILLARLGKMV